MARPRRPLSSRASTDSCSIRFSLRTIISGAFSSNRRFRRLLRLMTRRYRSFRSEVAKRPPSSGTRGRKSGGRTGRMVITIHSGRLLESLKASSSFRRLENFFNLVSDSVPAISSRIWAISLGILMAFSSSRTASAPIRASKSSPYSSMASRYCSSDKIWFFSRVVIPGSMTTKASKYSTRSISRRVISSSRPIREGSDFKYQIWATGLASSIWPIRSRRTLDWVTSTPHFSQITPRCLSRLYLPHKHS